MNVSRRTTQAIGAGLSNRRRRLLELLAALAFLLVSASAAAQVLVVLSDGTASYDVVADELRTGLEPLRDGRVRIDRVTAAHLASVDGPTFGAYEVIVPIGLSAAQAVMTREQDLPSPPITLCLLIPRQSFERLAKPLTDQHARRVSAVFIDQPLSRQLDLLRIALPDRRRVGVILGPSSRELEGSLRSEARSRDLSLDFARVGESSGVYAALQSVLPESDVLLLVPDPVVANADTVYGLLLTSYRAQTPVVGYSEGLLNAGALMSLFSTARQQGRQGAEIAGHILAHEALPAPQHPRYFTVRVNASVARSLGLHLPAESILNSALNGQADPVDEKPIHDSGGGSASRSRP